jgi:hypothetical protein
MGCEADYDVLCGREPYAGISREVVNLQGGGEPSRRMTEQSVDC